MRILAPKTDLLLNSILTHPLDCHKFHRGVWSVGDVLSGVRWSLVRLHASFALKIQHLRLETLCWMLDVGGEVQGEHMWALDLGDLYLVGSPTSPELLPAVYDCTTNRSYIYMLYL